MKTRRIAVRWLAAAGLLLIPLGRWAVAGEHPIPPDQAALIHKLEQARDADRAGAADPNLSPAEAADLLMREQNAQRVLTELRRGIEVDPGEVRAALEVPPSRLPKAQLIARLKAIQAEQKREAAMSLDDPVGLDELRDRQGLTDEVLKNLEAGQQVPWSQIQQALTNR